MKAWRTFQVVETFGCLNSLVKDGNSFDTLDTTYEAGVRFTIERITKIGMPTVYIDHSTNTLFTESRVEFLVKKRLMGEIFSEPANET